MEVKTIAHPSNTNTILDNLSIPSIYTIININNNKH